MLQEYRAKQAQRWLQKSTPSSLSSIQIDANSLKSLWDFFIKTEGIIPRFGILYGTNVLSQQNEIIVDAIYECSQDTTTGRILVDSRRTVVHDISSLMGLKCVGILTSAREITAEILVYSINIGGALVIIQVDPKTQSINSVFQITEKCKTLIQSGELTTSSTLKGTTVANGGFWLKDLVTGLNPSIITQRTCNDIIHTGFYRLNRPDHIPTCEDMKAFLIARSKTIPELHKQLADYHLILFIADTFGSLTAERIIISIFTEDDSLVEDVMEMVFQIKTE